MFYKTFKMLYSKRFKRTFSFLSVKEIRNLTPCFLQVLWVHNLGVNNRFS